MKVLRALCPYLSGVEVDHQLIQLINKAARDRVEGVRLLSPRLGSKQAGEQSMPTIAAEVDEIRMQCVVVLVTETGSNVADVAREVSDGKGLLDPVVLLPGACKDNTRET